jgi:hypothetical protein
MNGMGFRREIGSNRHPASIPFKHRLTNAIGIWHQRERSKSKPIAIDQGCIARGAQNILATDLPAQYATAERRAHGADAAPSLYRLHTDYQDIDPPFRLLYRNHTVTQQQRVTALMTERSPPFIDQR